ncbi:MAG: apolipoprotein N-acyltransferase [Gemmatimonadota bacterium]|nr:apolipoprotein N-acyltransferase [Gemmatimonadota bacterium]
MPRRGEWLLPTFSGLLLVCAFPPFHTVFPSFVALVPFAVWVARSPGGEDGAEFPSGAAAAARGGGVLGLVFHGLLLHWLIPALAALTPWAVPLYAAALAILVALSAGFGWAIHRMVHGARIPLWLSLAVAWTAAEWVQAHLPGSLAFPWLGLGTSLTGFPELVGIAELVGARGVTFWLAAVSGLLATAVRAGRRGVLRWGLIVAFAVLVPAGWGIWRGATLDTRPAARIAVVRTDVPAEARLDPEVWRERMGMELDEAFATIAPGSADLVVLPEGVLAGDPREADAVRDLRRRTRRIGAPVLFGAPAAADDGGTHNAVFVLGPGGLAEQRYEKRRLVPFVETDPLPMPGWARSGSRAALPLGAVRAGTGPSVLEVGGLTLGPLVCFEVIFADAARHARRAGADVLVNVSNDGWFDALYGAGRAAIHQHPSHLVMRAIEGRMGAARAANGGFTFFTDPVGRLHAASGPPGTGVAIATVRSTDTVTLFTRFGDVVGPLSVLAALAGVLGAGRVRSLDPRRGRV